MTLKSIVETFGDSIKQWTHSLGVMKTWSKRVIGFQEKAVLLIQ